MSNAPYARFFCGGSAFSRQQCGEGCSHEAGQGEKRKRESEGGNGAASATTTTPPKKAKETIRVSATRHDSQVRTTYWAFTLWEPLSVSVFFSLIVFLILVILPFL